MNPWTISATGFSLEVSHEFCAYQWLQARFPIMCQPCDQWRWWQQRDIPEHTKLHMCHWLDMWLLLFLFNLPQSILSRLLPVTCGSCFLAPIFFRGPEIVASLPGILWSMRPGQGIFPHCDGPVYYPKELLASLNCQTFGGFTRSFPVGLGVGRGKRMDGMCIYIYTNVWKQYRQFKIWYEGNHDRSSIILFG